MQFVKYNSNYECDEFFHYLKESPALLMEILSQDKYDFKQKTT